MIVKTTFDNEKDNANSSKAMKTYIDTNIGIRKSLNEHVRNTNVTDTLVYRFAIIPIERGKNGFKKVIMSANLDKTSGGDWAQTMFFYYKFKENADELEWIYFSRNYRSGLTYTVHPHWRYVRTQLWLSTKIDSIVPQLMLQTYLGDNLATTFGSDIFNLIPEL